MILSIICIAFLWGITNPFIKRGSKGINAIPRTDNNKLVSLFNEFKFLLTNPIYISSLSINLLGSLLFYYSLSKSDISLVVPICNTLTFLITSITGRILGEDTMNKSKK